MTTILIIDDHQDVRLSARIVLERQGYSCVEAEHPNTAKRLLAEQSIALILLDMNFSQDTTSGQEGLDFLRYLQLHAAEIPVVVITAWAKVDIAVKAMQLGASDFVEKPWQNKRLVQAVVEQLDASNTTLSESQTSHDAGFLAFSEPSKQLLITAARIAKTHANVLITGENGTGKSLLARYIHQHSARASEAMVSVNMAAIPDNLFESELFGHKKGAFTDAKEHRTGRFTLAANSTLFLDEIGTLPLPLQAKLLRVLETGQFEVLGSSVTETSHARIISATNANLEQAIEEGEFRRDLLFRLNTLVIALPPLRERQDEIPALVQHFIAKHSARYQLPAPSITPQALEKLRLHSWPGNIRELSHVLERAVILANDDQIDMGQLQLARPHTSTELPLMDLEAAEKLLIVKAIKHFDNNVIAAGEFLGLSKSAIYRRIEKFAITVKGQD